MALQLDDHQCALNVALHQYRKHHWLTEGAEAFHSLHHLLDEHIEKTSKHIDDIGERVAPAGRRAHGPSRDPARALVHQARGRGPPLHAGLPPQRPGARAEDPGDAAQDDPPGPRTGDWGTVEVLEDILVEREDLAYHLYSVLEDDTLVRGMTHLLDGQNDMAGDRPMPPDSKLQ